MKMLVLIVTAAATLPMAATTAGQSGTQAAAFDVASIKANTSGQRRDSVQAQPGGRYIAVNITPWDLILTAYDQVAYRVVNAPDWTKTARFDVNAKGEDPSGDFLDSRRGPSRLQLMLRGLLADRFQLRTHMEQRELPIYRLVLARADRRLGPKLKPSSADCDEIQQRRASGIAPATIDLSVRPTCTLRFGGDSLTAGAGLLSSLAGALQSLLRQTVIDNTGLAGRFDMDMAWVPEQLASTVAGASLFTALQEDLGLKLESGKGPVEVLVIDGIARPTED